jgi:ferredoxin
MQAFYGFTDGSGDWFIIIDTEKCNGCGKCIEECPSNVFEMREDEFDPLSEKTVATVREEERNKIRYDCAPCKPGYGEVLPPCIAVCEAKAVSHTEAWRKMHGTS